MAVNRRFMPYTQAAIFAVLADGASYARWVVGTANVEEIDDNWPEPNSRLRYQLGRVAFRKEDVTIAVRVARNSELELEAIGRPVGAATILITLDAVNDGCLVRIVETPKRGLAKTLNNPAFEALIWLRNLETLRRLQREVHRATHARDVA
jgi:hypothetical protein